MLVDNLTIDITDKWTIVGVCVFGFLTVVAIIIPTAICICCWRRRVRRNRESVVSTPSTPSTPSASVNSPQAQAITTSREHISEDTATQCHTLTAAEPVDEIVNCAYLPLPLMSRGETDDNERSPPPSLNEHAVP